MDRPRIGISLDTDGFKDGRKLYSINSDYAEAILKVGGLPLLLAHSADPAVQAQYVELIDGLLIPGGADCDPALYHAAPNPKNQPMDSLRQRFDLALIGRAEAAELPVLGICFGHQAMNVHRGGSLHQHLREAFPESTVAHSRMDATEPHPAHSVTFVPRTKAAAIFGAATIESNSRHRQAVERVGEGLIITGRAPDGVVESIEDPTKRFFLGVQWHPENLKDSVHEKLFAALVAAARAAADARRVMAV
jgi:putative glutamine amidotransferase